MGEVAVHTSSIRESVLPLMADRRRGCKRLSCPPEEQGLQFQRVCVDVAEKRILWDVSGHALPGHVLAVMGPSGSGKTTLINALAGYLPIASGSILLNGHKMNKKMRRKVSYVLQEDIFFPNLTLRETFRYSALIRLPSCYTFREKLNMVEEIIHILRLEDCANTIIGNALVRGLSGGEKKRANIGCELMTNPTMLLLDEPTSGLDSSSAHSLLELLRSLAEDEGKTIVTSIHQPSSQMYHMFDGLLLLAKGKVAYYGPASQALDHFARMGLHCTLHYNPADYIMELVTEADTRKMIIGEDPVNSKPTQLPWWRRWCVRRREKTTPQQVDILEYTASPRMPRKHQELPNGSVELGKVQEAEEEEEKDEQPGGKEPKWPTPWYWQFMVQFSQTFLLALVCCLVWFQIPYVEESIADRYGMLFFIVTYWGFSPMFLAIFTFPAERVVVTKERRSGTYHLSAYFVAKMLSELPLTFALPSIFIIITYWVCGLSYNFFAFLGAWFVLLVNSLSAQSIGLFIGATVLDHSQALVVAAILMLTSMLLGGFYVRSLPSWFKWAQWLSFINYSFDAMIQLQFTSDVMFSCKTDGVSNYLACNSTDVSNSTIPGTAVQEELEISSPLYLNITVLFIFMAVFRLLAYFVLRFARMK